MIPETDENVFSDDTEQDTVLAHKAICDVCNFTILETRYKCLNCRDFDICKFCEADWLSLQPHSLQHVFAKLERLKIGKVECHLPNLYTGLLEDFSEPEAMSDEAIWAQRKKSVIGNDNSIVHMAVICNSCNHPVIGARYSCLHCPSPYNLCEVCESQKNTKASHANNWHPVNHVFVKINFSLPDHNIHPCWNMPPLYKDHEDLTKAQHRIPKTQGNATDSKGKRHKNFNLKVREIEWADMKAVMAIECDSFAHPYTEQFMSKFICHRKRRIYVCESPTEKVAGYIAIARKFTDDNESLLEIVSLAVGPNSRRMGVGELLLKHGLNVGKGKCSRAVLHVSIYNFPAQELYKKNGFVAQNWIKNYYTDDQEDALEMSKIFQLSNSYDNLTDSLC